MHNISPWSCHRDTAPGLIYAFMFRHHSKSNVSEEVKAKPRHFSVVADGKFTGDKYKLFVRYGSGARGFGIAEISEFVCGYYRTGFLGHAV